MERAIASACSWTVRNYFIASAVPFSAWRAVLSRTMAKPMAEEGYQIVYQQFKDGMAADYTVFASGFNGQAATTAGAPHRPSGLAVGPDGALYVRDDKGGRIWKIPDKGR